MHAAVLLAAGLALAAPGAVPGRAELGAAAPHQAGAPAEAGAGNRAGTRLDRIRAAGVLRVCVWPNYLVMSFRNPRTGTLDGFDIEMAHAFAADLGVQADFVESSVRSLVEDLDRDLCDVAMFGIGVTPERAERVAFSAPYLRSGIYAVTTRTHRRIRSWDDIDQPGIVVAVQGGGYMVPIMRDALRHAELLIVTPPRTREQEVEAGLADAFVTDYTYTRRVLSMHGWARVIEPSAALPVTPYAYAVRRGDEAWLARLNAFLAAVKADGRLLAAARRFDLEPILSLD